MAKKTDPSCPLEGQDIESGFDLCRHAHKFCACAKHGRVHCLSITKAVNANRRKLGIMRMMLGPTARLPEGVR
jgi:hypothetical protein